MSEYAVTVFEVPGLKVNVGQDGVWMHFSSKSKVSASFNMDSLAEQSGPLISKGLSAWCDEQRELANRKTA